MPLLVFSTFLRMCVESLTLGKLEEGDENRVFPCYPMFLVLPKSGNHDKLFCMFRKWKMIRYSFLR